MDKITDKWQGYLKERFPRGEGGEPTVFKCPECPDESKDIKAWRQHITSHPQHQRAQSVNNINAFNQSAQAPVQTDTARGNCKRHAGDTPASNNVAELDREAKRRLSPPTNPQALSSPSNNRSRARDDYDQRKPHENTSNRQLWTPEDGMHPKGPTPQSQSQGQAVPITPQRQTPFVTVVISKVTKS